MLLSNPITPREHKEMLAQAHRMVMFLNSNPGREVCENCANLFEGRLCAKSNYAKVPDDYHGAGCGQWSEEIPF